MSESVEVERKLLVAESVELLDDQRSQNLLAAHPFTTCVWATGPTHEILVDPGERPRNAIQDRADRVPFLSVDVVDSTRDKAQAGGVFSSLIGVAVLSGVLGGTPRKHSLRCFYFHPNTESSACFQPTSFLDEN